MQWHKLPKEVLRTLGIEDKVSQQQNEDSVFSTDRQPLASSTQLKTPTKTGLDHVSHISSDDLDVPNKPRKVSFKDTPEKIPVVTNNNSNVSRNSLMEELNDIKVLYKSPSKKIKLILPVLDTIREKSMPLK